MGVDGFFATIPSSGDKVARVEEIGARENKAGRIVRAQLKMGFGLRSERAAFRLHGFK